MVKEVIICSTIVDSLDSLLIFGMNEEYEKAREWVANSLSFNVGKKSHAFEVSPCICL
jgi:hypothetical protein